MNRATRDKFTSGTNQDDLNSGNACWETAPAVFEKLSTDFGPFDLDLTADGQRHLCPQWFGPDSPLETDALRATWIGFGDTGYSNPPYGPFIARILAHARASAADGFYSTFLLPMRVTKAFRQHILNGASDLLFCDKRLTFFENGVPRVTPDKFGNLKSNSALFDSIIVRYRPGAHALRVGEWKVPVHCTQADIDRAIARVKVAA